MAMNTSSILLEAVRGTTVIARHMSGSLGLNNERFFMLYADSNPETVFAS